MCFLLLYNKKMIATLHKDSRKKTSDKFEKNSEKAVTMNRSSGVIMHISSLPEEYGIGTFGKQAYLFADFLHRSGQTYWQMLPLGHTSYGDSPYQTFSAFAGNPYFVDFELLAKDGLLDLSELNNIDFGSDQTQVDYGKVFKERIPVLRKAYDAGKENLKQELLIFAKDNSSWLDDYSLFMAVKNEMNLVGWQNWDNDIKLREKEAMEIYRELLADDIGFWVFIQYQFSKQWTALKEYTNQLGIKIIGDIPIYVASDSSDAWANSQVFQLDKDKNPITVAGCPPDAFSETGQLWGNPIYNWDYLEKTGYQWWIDRMKESLELYDMIRIDHFRGFEAYWEVSFGAENAINGKWATGPGMKLFHAIKKELGNVDIIAEDLGFLTDEFFDFHKESGYPGMKVMQFGFDPFGDNTYLPHNYGTDCIVYTGTHDNDTILGWIEQTGDSAHIKFARKYLKLNAKEGMVWGMIRGAWSSVSNIVITTMQDVLEQGNESRMNLPATLGGNWTWRMKKEDITVSREKKLYKLTKLYSRLK